AAGRLQYQGRIRCRLSDSGNPGVIAYFLHGHVRDTMLLLLFDNDAFLHRCDVTRPDGRPELIGQRDHEPGMDARPESRMLQIRVHAWEGSSHGYSRWSSDILILRGRVGLDRRLNSRPHEQFVVLIAVTAVAEQQIAR